MPEYYIGLMSGTSVDGIDAAVVDLSGDKPLLVFAHTFAWPDELRQQIIATMQHHEQVSLLALGKLDAAIGDAFANAALTALKGADLHSQQITAIGSHGQTLFHAPGGAHAFSLQSGDPNRIAERTGITTVADFRRRDIAAGGQGAPLVPAFHQALFQAADTPRAILNIGGMANLTLLPGRGKAVMGFDTGPGNILLDSWCQKNRGSRFDDSGGWAATGAISDVLLDRLLDHGFFTLPPPKSTGREIFSLHWLEQVLDSMSSSLAAADVQRTLIELTAITISDALRLYADNIEQVLVCGGGAHNSLLMRRLGDQLPHCLLETTEPHGLHPDWVEATAFAWLAKQTLDRKPGNLPSVTGAAKPVVLGAVYPA